MSLPLQYCEPQTDDKVNIFIPQLPNSLVKDQVGIPAQLHISSHPIPMCLATHF